MTAFTALALLVLTATVLGVTVERIEGDAGWIADWRCTKFGCAVQITVPTPTPLPEVALPIAPLVVERFTGIVTHYGASYEGQPLGCAPYRPYRSGDASIIAVGPAQYAAIPCGTALRVTGPAGSIIGTRQDSCPGCGWGHLDLSEAGMLTACGVLGRCDVTVEVLR